MKRASETEELPAKKRREESPVNHPNGVMPLGNLYLANSKNSRDVQLGTLGMLNDDMLLFVLGFD